jgi:hypothetical protein
MLHAHACCRQQRRAPAAASGKTIPISCPDCNTAAHCRALPRNAAKNSEYRFPRDRFNRRKKYKSASSPCAKEVLALRDAALKEFVLRTTLFPTTEQLRCSLTSHGVLDVLVERS